MICGHCGYAVFLGWFGINGLHYGVIFDHDSFFGLILDQCLVENVWGTFLLMLLGPQYDTIYLGLKMGTLHAIRRSTCILTILQYFKLLQIMSTNDHTSAKQNMVKNDHTGRHLGSLTTYIFNNNPKALCTPILRLIPKYDNNKSDHATLQMYSLYLYLNIDARCGVLRGWIYDVINGA